MAGNVFAQPYLENESPKRRNNRILYVRVDAIVKRQTLVVVLHHAVPPLQLLVLQQLLLALQQLHVVPILLILQQIHQPSKKNLAVFNSINSINILYFETFDLDPNFEVEPSLA